MQIATGYPDDGKSPFEHSYQASPTRFNQFSDGPLSSKNQYGEIPTMTFSGPNQTP